MPFRWLIRRRVVALWGTLSDGDLDALPLAEDMRFTFHGDHPLAVELRSARELRDWLRALFQRFPGLRFEVTDVVVGGPLWALRTATRYAAVQNGRTLYCGIQLTRIRWGRVVEEWVLPDTQAVVRLTAEGAER
jgi:ketosteroid isomerase-like protein